MPKYQVDESDQFLKNVEEAAVWILESNFDQSEVMANAKVDELGAELNALKERLGDFPESGEADSVRGLRRFPIYEGRFSAKWIVNHTSKAVVLISLADSKYPRKLRQFSLD